MFLFFFFLLALVALVRVEVVRFFCNKSHHERNLLFFYWEVLEVPGWLKMQLKGGQTGD